MDTLSLNVPGTITTNKVTGTGVTPSSTAESVLLSSDIGVSLKNVLSPDFTLPKGLEWYVMRASYGKNIKAQEAFTANGIFSYIPFETVLKKNKAGKNKKVRKPVFSNYIFVLTTFNDARLFTGKADTEYSLSYLDFAYDHTHQNEFGRDLRMTIPHAAMINFLRLAEFDTYKVHSVNPSEVRFVKDGLVRITDGVFKGITGRVARIHNQTTVVVTLDGVVSMTTAYIPQHFMEPITPTTQPTKG